jgi:RNA polymerase sigma-70 factor (sigma-E family)
MTGQRASFDAFVTANLDGLLRTAFLMTSDEKEAEDLVQECLFKVARRWARMGSVRHPVAYAQRVLINLAIDDAKHRARRRAELHDAVDVGADSPELARFGTRTELAATLGALAPRQRAVVVLRYFLDLSEAETARALGCSVGTVKSTASKALGRLRESIDPDQRRREVSDS